MSVTKDGPSTRWSSFFLLLFSNTKEILHWSQKRVLSIWDVFDSSIIFPLTIPFWRVLSVSGNEGVGDALSLSHFPSNKKLALLNLVCKISYQ